MSFVGSSELWGENSNARLCQILLEANDGMAQQVAENRTDLLDLLTLKDLEKVDDCGLSLPYLAVHYDRPDMIRYLHKRGLDFSKPCDPMEYGTPMFYAVNMGKMHIVETLDSLGISVNHVCDTYMKLTPSYYASRIGDPSVAEKIQRLQAQEVAAGELFMKNYLKQRMRRRYLRIRKAVLTIQRYTRGLADRIFVRLLRQGVVTLDSASVESNSLESSSHGRHKKHKSKRKLKAKSKEVASLVQSSTTSVNLENSLDSLSVEESLF